MEVEVGIYVEVVARVLDVEAEVVDGKHLSFVVLCLYLLYLNHSRKRVLVNKLVILLCYWHLNPSFDILLHYSPYLKSMYNKNTNSSTFCNPFPQPKCPTNS